MKPPIDRGMLAALTKDLHAFGDPADTDSRLRVLRTLYAVGRRDLPLGRLFEGHVDALQIIARYGSVSQWDAVRAAARNGSAFGVWNADKPGDPTILHEEVLYGSKAFASGAGVLSHALITVDMNGGRQLILVDLSATSPEIDRDWWRVTGMRRSETHMVRWTGAPFAALQPIGSPGDYLQEPWFSGGALRFAAVQAGGIAAIVDLVRDHLVLTDRALDPHQSSRLADLYLAAQSAADAVTRAATAWRIDDVPATLAHVAAARVAVYAAGETALTLAQAAVGVSTMFVDHPLAAMLTDLTVYLRQPAPDAQRQRAGEAVAAGLLTPGL